MVEVLALLSEKQEEGKIDEENEASEEKSHERFSRASISRSRLPCSVKSPISHSCSFEVDAECDSEKESENSEEGSRHK